MRDFPFVDQIVAAILIAQDLLGGLEPVGPGHERRVAEELEREARRLHVDLRARVSRLAAVGHRGDGGLDPFEEIRRAVAHLRENPRAVFDMRVGGHAAFGGIDEVLRSGRFVALTGRRTEKLRRGLEPRTGSPTPRVVAVGRGNDDHRHVGVRGDVVGDFVDTFVRIAEAVGQDVVRGHGIHFLFLAGLGVDVFHPVQSVGEGCDIPRGIAWVGLAEPPLAGIVKSVGDLVGAIGRAGLDAEIALWIRLVVVTRTGAADVVTGHQRPFETFIDEHIDEIARVTHLRGEKSLRVIGQIRVAAPRLPPRMLEGLNFFAEDGLREQRTKRVVVGEPEHVHARRAGRRLPTACLAEARIPVSLIAEMAAAAELADIVD